MNGKPASYAELAFVPADEDIGQDPLAYMMKTSADEDGKFRLSVRKRDKGQNPVEYQVGVSWRIPKDPQDRKDPNYGPQLLPVKLQTPAESGISVTILPQITELDPIEIRIAKSGG